MSFPRYPKYKNSDVEWLGEVPEHWHLLRVKNIFKIGRGRVISLEDANENGSYPVFSSQTTNDGCLGYIETFDFDCNQLTWTTDGANAGTVFLRKGKHNCTNVCGTLQIKSTSSYNLSLGLYCLSFATQFYKRPDTNGAKIMNGEMAEVMVLMPPAIEQDFIVAFLDRETAKIDELVSEQLRLMELLKEKRRAVISHAVTKGLNPNAPMKPSGIEWLGDVPVGWATPAMYMRYSTELGKMLDSAKITGNHLIPYMRNVDVQWGSINFEDLPSMDIHENDYERYTVKSGDLLVCEGGEVGRAAIVPPVSGIFGYQKALHRLRALDGSEDSSFMFFTLLWAANTGIFDQSGSSTIAHLTGEQLRKYRFPKPPISEQRAIAQFLEAESTKLDTLTAEAQRAINLLQERRTALISAAVTGQIDVRSKIATDLQSE